MSYEQQSIVQRILDGGEVNCEKWRETMSKAFCAYHANEASEEQQSIVQRRLELLAT